MKRLVVIVLVLCFVCLFLAGCAPQATEEEIQAVDEATAVMADSRFDVGTMTDVPISLLGISEDAIQKSALYSMYTKSTEDVIGADAEYTMEPTQDKEIKVQVEEGKVSNVWITVSRSAIFYSNVELWEIGEDFLDNIAEISDQYTIADMEVDEEDATIDSWVSDFMSGTGKRCMMVLEDDEVPGFFIMAHGIYDAGSGYSYISYSFNQV